jgi:hypothetical protein
MQSRAAIATAAIPAQALRIRMAVLLMASCNKILIGTNSKEPAGCPPSKRLAGILRYRIWTVGAATAEAEARRAATLRVMA